MRDDSFRSPSVCNSAKPRLGSIKNLPSRWKVFSAVCPRIIYLLQPVPVWQKQRPIHLKPLQPIQLIQLSAFPLTSVGSCHSIPAFGILDFGLGVDPSHPNAWILEHKGVTSKNKQKADMHREEELYSHIFLSKWSHTSSQAPVMASACHQTFWKQNHLVSFKTGVFKHIPHLTLLGSQQDIATPLDLIQNPRVSMERHFISHKIYTKHY